MVPLFVLLWVFASLLDMLPAMEERVTFAHADLTYLANLCHNCGECLYACQFAPPHEFGS